MFPFLEQGKKLDFAVLFLFYEKNELTWCGLIYLGVTSYWWPVVYN